jgi:lysophospholipase L1-like esterase
MMRTLYSILLTALIALIALPAHATQVADVAAPKILRDGTVDPAFMRRHTRLVEIAALRYKARVVFLGDSITARWSQHKALFDLEFGQYRALNFGIPGDRTQHVMWRVQEGLFDVVRPRVVVLLIGTNNATTQGTLMPFNPPEEVAAGVRHIIDDIHLRSPETKILLHGILPRGAKNPAHRNAQVNTLISQFHDGERIHYLDIGNQFLLPDGSVSPVLMPDLLHLSEDGYRIWADAIRAKLAELTQ